MTTPLRKWIAPLLISLLAACGGGGSAGTNPPDNPVTNSIGDFPDPFVLVDNGLYFAYATNGQGKNVQVLRSSDRLAWTPLADAMPELPSWARTTGSFVWAPEVIKLGGRYLLYFTARDKTIDKQCIGVAVANKPEGPFKDVSSQPLVCQVAEGGTIDASPFLDGGKLFLYFKNDGNCCGQPTWLYAQELAADGLSLLGAPVRLLRNEHAWEGAVIEAPTMLLYAGSYFLFYSGNDYGGTPYAVGYATCAGPIGPCTAAPENPILKSRATAPVLIGPGHTSIFLVGTQHWMAYHAWEVLANGQRGSRRLLYIDKLNWVDGKPVVRGPTLVP